MPYVENKKMQQSSDEAEHSEHDIQSREFQEYMIEAPIKNTPMGIFWDFENIQVKNIEEFAEIVRCHMKKFHRKHFYAAAKLGVIKQNRNIEKKMKNAVIKLCCAPNGKDEADNMIKNEMQEFYNQRGKSCWMVLITGDYGFYETIIRYKHTYDFENIVLIFDDRQDSTEAGSRMTNNAPYKIPVSYFLRQLPISKKQSKKEATVKSFNPGEVRQEMGETSKPATVEKVAQNMFHPPATPKKDLIQLTEAEAISEKDSRQFPRPEPTGFEELEQHTPFFPLPPTLD